MRTIVVGLVLVMSSAAWAQKIPLNVKLGLWEATSTHTMTGQMPVSPEMLARLTPEQRARVEEVMKKRASGTPTTTTYKSCLTKEELERGTAFKDRKDCTQSLLTSSSSKMAIKVACDIEGMKADGTMEFEALSPEHVKGQGHFTVNGGGRTMNSNTTFESKWISSDCGSVK